MSAKKFISELERRKFLSDRLMVKLRESLAAQKSPLSAEALAKFLVTKQHLTQRQANDILGGLTQSGVNLAEEDADTERGEDSSIFASHIGSFKPHTPPPAEEEDEIRLAPIDDEAPAKTKLTLQPIDEEDVPTLGVVVEEEPLMPVEPPHERRKTSRPEIRVAEVIEEVDNSEMVEIAAVPDSPKLADAAPAIRRSTGLSRGGKKDGKKDSKKKKSTKDKKSWDSPLILIGGGSLVFLLLAGALIWFLLNWQSGDQKLELARDAMKSGAYQQAIKHFEDFLTSSPRHAEHSVARVQLAMLRIRQPTEGNDFKGALAASETEVKAIEEEEAFKNAHEELAGLMPQIAQGLAKQAEQASPTSDDSKQLVELANKALELCNNITYVPKPLRDETKLANVRDTLIRVERRQQSQLALAEGLKAMDQAVSDGKPISAYAVHMKLLKEHPELADEKGLSEALKKTADAELAAIKFVSESKTAETTERPTPWVAALAVATRRATGTVPGADGVVCVRIDGAVYGLEAPTGKLLWRRYVGFGSTGWPILIGSDVIIADTVRHELMRLDAASGKLLWRQAFDEAFAEPLVAGDRGFVASDSGKLYVVDLKSGARTGYVQLAQPIRVAPAIDRLKANLYVAGDRANLYSIGLADMKCNSVYFLGHAPGTIQVAPAYVMDKVAVLENNGVETSRLHLLQVDSKGPITKQLAERRVNGLATAPPIATGRGLIVVSDRGQIDVCDIAAGAEGEPLTLVASREAPSSQPLTRYVAVTGRNIWVADTQLTKYNIVPTGNRLPVEEITNNLAGSTFDHPLFPIGDALVEVHRPKGRAGVVIAAIDTKQGRTIWETDLATPPAGAPVVDDAAKAITVANAAGFAFRFDEQAMRTRVQDQPLATPLAPPQLPTLTASADLGQGRAVFCGANSNWLLLYNPAQGNSAKWIQLDSPLACPAAAFGQGFLAPLKIGQVFYLSSADGSRLATPFQPRVDPQAALEYKPPGVLKPDARQFVITDGTKKIYLVGLADQPQPNLQAVKEAEVGPKPINSPVVVIGDTALAVAGENELATFKLPAVEQTGKASLPAPVEWGPYPAGDVALVATVDQKLLAVSPTGEVKWQVSLEHGQLAGPPLVQPEGVLLAYRKGILERRALADGKPLATLNVEQPLATGPVAFLQRIVAAAADGTLLVVDQPK